jgi:branched-subunit amino acid transport protein
MGMVLVIWPKKYMFLFNLQKQMRLIKIWCSFLRFSNMKAKKKISGKICQKILVEIQIDYLYFVLLQTCSMNIKDCGSLKTIS